MAEGQGFITKVHTPRQSQQPEESFVPQIENATNTKRKDAGSRVCDYCGTTRTPMWRRGPRGKHTLCNACGVKWKDGRIQIPIPDLELQQQQIPVQEQKQETQPSLVSSFPYKPEDIHNAALFLQTLDKMHENSQVGTVAGFHNADTTSTAPSPTPTLLTSLYATYELPSTKASLNSPVTNANANADADDMEEDDDEDDTGSYENLNLSKVLPKKKD